MNENLRALVNVTLNLTLFVALPVAALCGFDAANLPRVLATLALVPVFLVACYGFAWTGVTLLEAHDATGQGN